MGALDMTATTTERVSRQRNGVAELKASRDKKGAPLRLTAEAGSCAENLGIGSAAPGFAAYIAGQLLQLAVSKADQERLDGGEEITLADTNALLALAASIEPKDEMEAALAAQMAAVHHLTMDCAGRAMNPAATMEGRALNLSQMGKLSRTYAQLLDSLNRHRGKSTTQRVIVENYTQNGGQSVVGIVNNTPGGAKRIEPEQVQATPCEDRGGQRPPLLCADAGWLALHESNGTRKEALPNARGRARERSAEGKPQRVEARRAQRAGRADAAADNVGSSDSPQTRGRRLAAATL